MCAYHLTSAEFCGSVLHSSQGTERMAWQGGGAASGPLSSSPRVEEVETWTVDQVAEYLDKVGASLRYFVITAQKKSLFWRGDAIMVSHHVPVLLICWAPDY